MNTHEGVEASGEVNKNEQGIKQSCSYDPVAHRSRGTKDRNGDVCRKWVRPQPAQEVLFMSLLDLYSILPNTAQGGLR